MANLIATNMEVPNCFRYVHKAVFLLVNDYFATFIFRMPSIDNTAATMIA